VSFLLEFEDWIFSVEEITSFTGSGFTAAFFSNASSRVGAYVETLFLRPSSSSTTQRQSQPFFPGFFRTLPIIFLSIRVK
jgi:hypothetical protein